MHKTRRYAKTKQLNSCELTLGCNGGRAGRGGKSENVSYCDVRLRLHCLPCQLLYQTGLAKIPLALDYSTSQSVGYNTNCAVCQQPPKIANRLSQEPRLLGRHAPRPEAIIITSSFVGVVSSLRRVSDGPGLAAVDQAEGVAGRSRRGAGGPPRRRGMPEVGWILQLVSPTPFASYIENDCSWWSP
jgi:hypothetical protein